MKKTAGIFFTILTILLCGLPGLGLAGFGLLGLIGTQIPGTTVQTSKGMQDALIGGAMFIGGGILLMLIPIVVGFLSLRKKRAASPIYPAPVPQSYPGSVQPVYSPPQPQQYQAPQQSASQPISNPVYDPLQDLYSRLMALNRPTAPYRIVDGRSENVDLIAEWKIVDAQWFEVFAKASLSKVFRIYLKFDPARREVRAMDREYTVSWRGGVPSLGGQASFFKGQKSSVSFGIGTGFKENLAPGVVYKYKFNTNELKQPIQQVIASCGWSYKGVAFGKL
jgi:hypothetical protein